MTEQGIFSKYLRGEYVIRHQLVEFFKAQKIAWEMGYYAGYYTKDTTLPCLYLVSNGIEARP